MMIHVVKRNKMIENYNAEKLYTSIYRSCLAVHTNDADAKKYAQQVAAGLEKWAKKHREFSTNDLRKVASELLYDFEPHASYLYAHHRIII